MILMNKILKVTYYEISLRLRLIKTEKFIYQHELQENFFTEIIERK